MGYTPDFVQTLAPLLAQVKKQGIKVVSNAGGINPLSCVEALHAAAKQAGVNLSIAMVTGDDLLPKVMLGHTWLYPALGGPGYEAVCVLIDGRGSLDGSEGDGHQRPFTRQEVHQRECLSGVSHADPLCG